MESGEINMINPAIKFYGRKKALTIWFIGEIIQIVLMIMGGIMLLWLYAPYTILTKVILTSLSILVTFDVFKNFVYIRWLLLKEE